MKIGDILVCKRDFDGNKIGDKVKIISITGYTLGIKNVQNDFSCTVSEATKEDLESFPESLLVSFKESHIRWYVWKWFYTQQELRTLKLKKLNAIHI